MAERLSDLLGLTTSREDGDFEYIEYLAGLSLDSLVSAEPQSLAQSAQSLLRSVQSLSKRSHRLMVDSAAGHASLTETIPSLAQKTSELSQAVPRLDTQAEHFSVVFGKSADCRILAGRKESLRLLQNSERLVDLMELPPLLLSSVSTNPLGYSSALDLHSHVRRLSSLYPDSKLVSSVSVEADEAIRALAANLITALKAPNLKLAAALRAVGFLKRVISELSPDATAEDVLPSVFLICRFSNLVTTLEALEPLRGLADEEKLRQRSTGQLWSGGQQTERFLKRFIEVFREHSFSIISISSNVGGSFNTKSLSDGDPLASAPPVLATFPMHLVGMLLETLQNYLSVVKDQASRESVLTQVLYCSGSLGRLGADFGMLLPTVGVNEWAELVKRHRLLAGRLESVIGDFRSQSTPVHAV